MEKRLADGRILRNFAIGQLGWAILSGVVSNWLLFFYMPSEETIAQGMPLFITQGLVFAGMTVRPHHGVLPPCRWLHRPLRRLAIRFARP